MRSVLLEFGMAGSQQSARHPQRRKRDRREWVGGQSGFINLHSHSVAQAGYRLELLDGVTTVLELEAGSFPIARFGQQLGDEPLTHFGASVGHAWIRMQVVDPEALAAVAATGKIDMSGSAYTQAATPRATSAD